MRLARCLCWSKAKRCPPKAQALPRRKSAHFAFGASLWVYDRSSRLRHGWSS
jgi:hypothetical protein